MSLGLLNTFLWKPSILFTCECAKHLFGAAQVGSVGRQVRKLEPVWNGIRMECVLSPIMLMQYMLICLCGMAFNHGVFVIPPF